MTELPQAYAGRGNMKAEQSAVRLTEVRTGEGVSPAKGPAIACDENTDVRRCDHSK